MCINKIIAKTVHNKLYNHRLSVPNIGVKYFASEDFKGLMKEPFNFYSSFSDLLRGFIYYREGHKDDVLVIFVHGNGGGHLAYIKEINRLTEAGFKVLAYDVTGTLISEGKTLRGFYQMASDLKALLKVVNERYKDLPIYLVGHSLGGYSVLNALKVASEHNVKKIVSISALKDMETMIKTISSKKMEKAIDEMIKIEEKIYGKDVYFDATNYLPSTPIKTFLIHSEDDGIVDYKTHFIPMKECALNNKNVTTLTVNGHLHNPTYTLEANKALAEYFTKLNSLKKKKDKIALMEQNDFHKISTLDEEIMCKIIDYLEN